MSYQAEKTEVLEAASKFPESFGLRGHDGIFCINPRRSYVSEGRVLLYVYTDSGEAFCKAEPTELRQEIQTSTAIQENANCPECNHQNAMLWVSVPNYDDCSKSTRHLACRACGYRDAKDWTQKEYRDTFTN